MSDDSDIVYFMHNGEKVSNDPRFLAQQQLEKAQRRAKLAESVGISDPILTDGLQQPREDGVEDDTSDDDPVDSDDNSENPDDSSEDDTEDDDDDDSDDDEDVDDEGEGDVSPYDKMNAKELKAEVKSRRDAGREIDTKGITKKSELVEVLKADDAAQASE